MTIRWNNIQGVYNVAPAGQTIPLFLGIAAMSIVIYSTVAGETDEDALLQRAAEPVLLPMDWAPVMAAAADPLSGWSTERGYS